jgi:metal-sulfur cluster biosynthetic enzyme
MIVTREQVTRALAGVFDPELGMSVVDLGLIEDVRIEAGRVHVTMTLTTPGCPLHDAMADWVHQAVAGIPGVEEVQVVIVVDGTWTPDRIGQPARWSAQDPARPAVASGE